MSTRKPFEIPGSTYLDNPWVVQYQTDKMYYAMLYWFSVHHLQSTPHIWHSPTYFHQTDDCLKKLKIIKCWKVGTHSGSELVVAGAIIATKDIAILAAISFA